MKKLRSILLVCLALAACFAFNAFVEAGTLGTAGTLETIGTLGFGVLAVAPIVAAPAGFDVSRLRCITVEEFQKLKERFLHLYVIDVVIDDDESYQFIVRRPDRALLSAIADKKNNVDAANDMIIKNLMVAGNASALDDGLVFAGFMKQVGWVMQSAKSFFGKA
jgi:hypothetical protein